jgi:soluble lytic murein transglycosylase-like protein
VGSKEIALPILYYAEQRELSLSLVFSLVWVESRFKPTAVNRNSTSIDRGLFQLNNRSFPHLSENDFFDTHVNARHGTSYLRFSLNQFSDWQKALAVYNAGLSRVRANEIPSSTKVYVTRVSAYREYVEKRFRRYITERFPLPTGIRIADDNRT